MNTTDFYTVPRSEEGLRVPLLLPNDQDSGEWLLIHGPDSEAFARSQAILLRRGGEIGGIEDAGERERLAVQINADYLAPLVKGWSFDKPCTFEAVHEFLLNAPAIARGIVRIAGDRSRFFGPGSPSSTPGPASSEPSEVAAVPPSDAGSESTAPVLPNSNTSSPTGASSDPGA